MQYLLFVFECESYVAVSIYAFRRRQYFVQFEYFNGGRETETEKKRKERKETSKTERNFNG